MSKVARLPVITGVLEDLLKLQDGKRSRECG
jgi:hypothetical protein